MTLVIRGRHLALVAAGVVMGALIGGVAWASIPDSKGVIHGCYANTSPHTLQVIDTATTASCPSGTTAMNWNAKGPPGPSNAYAAHHDASVSLSSAGSTLVSLSLPAGNFVITGKTEMDTALACAKSCPITKFAQCVLQAGSDSDNVSVGTEGADGQGSFGTDRMAAPAGLVVVHSSTTAFTASLVCSQQWVNNLPEETDATYSKIVAIKVGSLSNITQ
jgi:hypothetical protein